MTNEEIIKIATEQSAEDIGCKAEDFFSSKNVVVPFKLGKNARKYYKEPITANFVSYGNNLVAATTNEVSEIIQEYISRYEFYHCFETPNLHWLNEKLLKKGNKVCFMAEYYLPDVTKLKEPSCNFDIHLLEQKDFQALYLPEWSNAICEDRKELDVLGLGAYEGNKLIGLAACSADAQDMWQIGVDVLPEYRKKGIASSLTTGLALEIIKRNKIPFYCSAWSNIRSVKNAIKSVFVPAWVEMTIKPISIVDDMNKLEKE